MSLLANDAIASRNWYLLQTKPRQAERALEHLERQAYSCFLPLQHVERVVRGRRQQQVRPLFPNYLFIQLDEQLDNWMPIRSTRGVSRFVSFGGLPAQVPHELIEQLRERPIPAGSLLQPGDRVRITCGSFADMEAIFLAHDDEERVLLLIKLLQRENTLAFPLKDVSKV
jgi:transcriptional antiterminator RfaH